MARLDPDDRDQIEQRLGRALATDELAIVPAIDQLSRAQLEVVAKLGSAIILASHYARACVPTAELSAVRDLVCDVDRVIDRRFPPARLRMEHLYAAHVGRALTDDERRKVDTLGALSPAQLDLARVLARIETVSCVLYLGDVVRSAAAGEREALAARLSSAS